MFFSYAPELSVVSGKHLALECDDFDAHDQTKQYSTIEERKTLRSYSAPVPWYIVVAQRI